MLTLVSFDLCPYVQRVAIALAEKSAAFERVYVDLADKPEWFKAISPLSKVPLLDVDGNVIFESAVILEYLEDTIAPALHPHDPLRRAEHRSWVEYGSVILTDIAAFYNAPDASSFEARHASLADRFSRLEAKLTNGLWFDGAGFSLVDTAFAPVFRYFDIFEKIGISGVLEGKPKIATWRRSLAARPSVADAVTEDYGERLLGFLRHRGSYISARLRA